jgi:integrase
MSVYKRGGTWWFKFRFGGQVIRESAKTTSKTVAREAERARRRHLELAINRISRRERPPLLSVAVQQWLDSRSGLAPHTLENYRLYANRLLDYFGQRLVSDFTEVDIAHLIRDRQHQGLKPRRINFELAVLRMVLRHFNVWDSVKGRIRPLRESHDVGRAISRDDEERILGAIRDSRTPSLLPLFTLAIDTGLRASELRGLRYKDLNLKWNAAAIESGWLNVAKFKTEGGTGRAVPLSRRCCAVLTIWLSRFSDPESDAYVFPFHRIAGNYRCQDLFAVDASRPIGSWKKAWRGVLKAAGLHFRWHDLRHTFVSRLAENPLVSEQTIMTLAGHVSKAMLSRYSHIRSEAKLAAIASLERVQNPTSGAQNEAHSDAVEDPSLPN